MSQNFNKNEKQIFFNRIRGVIEEINVNDIWCSYTLLVGHENQRLVNFSIKKEQYDKLSHTYKVGDKVGIRFFLSSKYKNGRWHTSANILTIED